MDNETKSEITQLFSSIMVLIRYQKVYWDKTISTGGIEMFVQDDLSIKSMTVSQIYDLFLNGRLIVNRKYQRKLCWSIEEKRNFMDTIMKRKLQ